MKIENIKKIGIKNNVKDIDVFVKFLSKRFPNESDRLEGYFTEWATRFNTGNPTRYMDDISLAIYKEVMKNEL